jgi:DNA replication protein DnaC
LAACQPQRSVLFVTAAALVPDLLAAREEKRRRALQKQLAAVPLLLVEALGDVPFPPSGAELLFEVFSRRSERGAPLITSTLPFAEGTSVGYEVRFL